MHRISFMYSQTQIIQRVKTVTRRLEMLDIEVGDVLVAHGRPSDSQPTEETPLLATIRVVDIRREALSKMLDDEDYGREECRKEGYGGDPVLYLPSAFVQFFCQSHVSCTQDTVVTRIEFEYVD